MSVEAISPSQYFGLTPKTQSKSELNSEMFMRLLTVQLANQNPLEPMNDRDFFAQMAQLGTVEGLDKIQDSMRVAQASSLIGKQVTAIRPMTEGTTGQNGMVTGEVTRLTIKNGEYFVGVKEANGGVVEIKLDNIREVKNTSTT